MPNRAMRAPGVAWLGMLGLPDAGGLNVERAEVRLFDLRVVSDLVRCSRDQQLAEIEHDDVIDEVKHLLHRMVDDQDGGAGASYAAQDCPQLRALLFVHAGEWLIHDDD